MSYIAIIPLPEVKNFLRIDEYMIQDDAQITMMLAAAFRYIEKRTQHIMYARDKEYIGNLDMEDWQRARIPVYDYPINFVVSPVDYTDLRYNSYTSYSVEGETNAVTLNVGYTTPELVPETFKNLALQLVDYWYYRNEKKISDSNIPELIQQSIDIERRFV